jgi:phosphate transport system protein
MQQHTLSAFDADIDGMRSAILTMGGLAERQVTRAVQGLISGDRAIINEVIVDEAVLNKMHLQADGLCNLILAKRAPFAGDLREVIAAIHTIADIERIGDEAKKIALKARDFQGPLPDDAIPLMEFTSMTEMVRGMLHTALDAFLQHDSSSSALLNKRDDEVDAARDHLHDLLIQRVGHETANPKMTMELIFVIQSLERIGDHAKNIAEYVATVVDGVDRRHQNGPGASIAA